MNSTSLFNLAGPDLIMIALIVALLFGARKFGNLPRHLEEEDRRWEEDSREYPQSKQRLEKVNRWIVLLAVAIFLLACGLWLFGPPD